MRRAGKRLFLGVLVALSLARISAQEVVPGLNVNMVSGTTWPDGDVFQQRQNEPAITVSTRNVRHLLAGSNDYRTVDLPGLPADKPNGDAWLGVYKSVDGGETWKSTLLPGYPQDSSATGNLSPLKGFDAAADPIVRAGANGLLFYSGIAFQRAAIVSSAPPSGAAAAADDDNRSVKGKAQASKKAKDESRERSLQREREREKEPARERARERKREHERKQARAKGGDRTADKAARATRVTPEEEEHLE